MANITVHDHYIVLGGPGIKLHYRETGTPDGFPVVALHGHPGTAHVWDETARAVCAAGPWRFTALTMRGHGASDRAATYDFEAVRDDVYAFIDALGLSRFVLIGHSMGGTVSALAAQAPDAPPSLAGVVLVDAVPPKAGRPRPAPQRPSDAEVAALPHDWAVVPALSRQLGSPKPQWWEGLARIEVPALVVAGGSTSHVPQDLLAESAGRMPRARLVTLEGAGHAPQRTQPGRFQRELIGFLESVVTDSPTEH